MRNHNFLCKTWAVHIAWSQEYMNHKISEMLAPSSSFLFVVSLHYIRIYFFILMLSNLSFKHDFVQSETVPLNISLSTIDTYRTHESYLLSAYLPYEQSTSTLVTIQAKTMTMIFWIKSFHFFKTFRIFLLRK